MAPSLSYRLSDKLSVLLNAEFYNGESTNAEMLFLIRNTALKVFNTGYQNRLQTFFHFQWYYHQNPGGEYERTDQL